MELGQFCERAVGVRPQGEHHRGTLGQGEDAGEGGVPVITEGENLLELVQDDEVGVRVGRSQQVADGKHGAAARGEQAVGGAVAPDEPGGEQRRLARPGGPDEGDETGLRGVAGDGGGDAGGLGVAPEEEGLLGDGVGPQADIGGGHVAEGAERAVDVEPLGVDPALEAEGLHEAFELRAQRRGGGVLTRQPPLDRRGGKIDQTRDRADRQVLAPSLPVEERGDLLPGGRRGHGPIVTPARAPP